MRRWECARQSPSRLFCYNSVFDLALRECKATVQRLLPSPLHRERLRHELGCAEGKKDRARIVKLRLRRQVVV